MKKSGLKVFVGMTAAAVLVMVPIGSLYAEPLTPTLVTSQELVQSLLAEQSPEEIQAEANNPQEVNTPAASMLQAIFVNGDNVPVYQAPGMESPISFLSKGSSAFLMNKGEEWSQVLLSNGINGYILNSYISESPIQEESPVVSREMDRSSAREEKAQKVIAAGKSRLGSPYVYGSTGPNSFDCSGFTTYAFKNGIGMTLQRTSRDQAGMGTSVKRDELQAGDLLFFDTNGGLNNVTHVGIYVGDGQFIHASSGVHRKVVVSELNEGYYTSRFMGARRVID